MILTFEDFLEIMKTNSKENPLKNNNVKEVGYESGT